MLEGGFEDLADMRFEGGWDPGSDQGLGGRGESSAISGECRVVDPAGGGLGANEEEMVLSLLRSRKLSCIQFFIANKQESM